MRSWRYVFFQDENQTLTLVFDDAANQWLVEVGGPRLTPTRFPLEAFEKSDDAHVHAGPLMDAIGQATRDA